MTTSNAPVTHSRCRCSACGEVFSVVSNFDKHRKGGECLDPASVGMELKVGPNGSWWGMPGGDFRARKGETCTMYRVASKNRLAVRRESGTEG